MSDDKSKSASPAAVQAPPAHAPVAAPTTGTGLTDLMAHGDKAGKPNLDAQALRAAEHALAEGERALAAARTQLHSEAQAPASPRRRRRELALRALLVINVMAMLVVSMLPSPGEATKPTVEPVAHAPKTQAPHLPPSATTPKFEEPWAQALAAAERGEFPVAITTLEKYLAANPRMQAGQKASVLNTLSYYASLAGDWKRSADFERQFDALKGSHSLPDDLVQEARQALESGDQEKLRQTWARFLLQQKQIPTWLYKHVAAAYLQLGDSYRNEAEAAAEVQRLQDLKAADAALREAAMRAQEKGK